MLVPTSARSAFGWPTPSFMGLGDLPGGNFESWAHAISADGSTVVGEGNSDAGVEAFRWTVSEGMMGLGGLTGGSFFSRAFGTSADGSVIVGGSNSGIGREAFRWTPSAGMDHLSGGLPGSDALATSADGSVIVGLATDEDENTEAFIWDDAHGMRSLFDVLTIEFDLDLSNWSLDNVAGVSADGMTIVGSGYGPEGYQAWIASIPEPATLLLFAIGLTLCRHRTFGAVHDWMYRAS